MGNTPHGADPAPLPLINGERVSSASEATVDVVNPSNGKRLLSIPAGCEADVDRAVIAARCAFDEGRWIDLPPATRKKILHRFADLIAEHSACLDALDAGEMGKPIGVTLANAMSAANLMRFYAEATDKVMGDVFSSDRTSFVSQRRIPHGVVAAITPWNFPTTNVVRKIAPALAAGNSVVLKPSELASRSAMHMAQLALEAGVPPGVLNVIPGLGETVGLALGRHSDVDMLTFTGSTQVGKAMLRYAGDSNMKVVMAECGGKSPQIVFDDGIDLNAVCERIARFLLTNQGQICSVGSRVLVQRSVEAALIERLAAHFDTIIMGDALDPRTNFGPLASAAQRARVMQYIDAAGAEGAELIKGGRCALLESGGYFVEPTLLSRVAPSARVAQEEIFGPVLAVIPFDDEAEAIRIANGTAYGLAAYVWTANLSTAMRVAKAIRSSVWINAAAATGEGAGHAASFEPCGLSGVGVEGGLAGMESYLRRQTIWINHG